MKTWTNGASTTLYDYNPDNMRCSKTTGNTTTEHVWLGTDIALDISGQNVVSYINGIKSDYGWYVYNAHGDVVQLADNGGNIVKFYDYDPYGNQLSEIDQLDRNPYRFSGEYYDSESGYVYLRARYYDTSLGRFISEDPAFDGYNWYVYAGNNPVLFVDPSGNIAIVDDIVIWGIVGVYCAGVAIIGIIDASNKTSADTGAKSKPPKNPTKNEKTPTTGEPNTSTDIIDKKGNVTGKRHYGPDGRAEKDEHYTDHGNPKKHPKVPHEHKWDWNNPKKPTISDWY